MNSLNEHIKKTRLIKKLVECLTSGDVEYCGNTLEINETSGNELATVVVDKNGEQQVILYPQAERIRIPLDEFLEKLNLAKSVVKKMDS